MNCQIFKAALNNIEIFCVENVKNAMCIQCKWLCITKQRKNEINKIIKVHKKPVVKDSKRQREKILRKRNLKLHIYEADTLRVKLFIE